MIPFLLSAVLSFLLYLRTLYPTVGPGDSGELIAAAYTLGIAHPPGYPLYCLLGKLFTFLPFGNIAYRLNLMSALFASLTVGMVSLLSLELLQRFGGVAPTPLAFLTALLFAVSVDFWAQAVSAEVYTLHLFIFTALLWLFFRWDRSRATSLLYPIAFLVGLGLTNHHTLLAVIPPILLLAAMEEPRLFRNARILFVCLLLFSLPLLLYLYLPLRARTTPFVWGGERWQGLLYHLFRLQYLQMPVFLKRDLALYGGQLLSFLHVLGEQVPRFLWPLALWGGVQLFRKDSKAFFLFGVLFLETLLLMVFSRYEATATTLYLMRPFFLPPTLLLCLLIAVSLQDLLRRLPWKSRLAETTLIGFYLFSISWSLLLSYPVNDRSWRSLAETYGQELLRTAPPQATLILSGDEANFVSYYLRYAQGQYRDLHLFGLERGVFPTTTDKAFFQRWQELKKSSPTHALYTNARHLVAPKGWRFVQEGLLRRLVSEGEEAAAEAGWPGYRIEIEPYLKHGDFLEKLILTEVVTAKATWLTERGEFRKAREELQKASLLAGTADDLNSRLGYFYLGQQSPREAIEPFQRALLWNPSHTESKKGLAVAFGLLGEYQKSVRFFEEVLKRWPRDSGATFNLGVSLGNLGRFSEALQWFRHTAVLAPEYPGLKEAMERARQYQRQPSGA